MENTTVSVYARITDPLKFVTEFGMSLAKSQMFGCSNPEQGHVMAMACLTEGISPVEVAKKYHIIQGRLSMRSDAMLAKFRELGGKHRIVERTADAAEIELTLDGQSQKFRFTFEEAKQEKFVYGKDGKTLKDNWATPRGRMQMLWARVASDGVRCMAPEVNAGTYTPEEVRDFTDGNGVGASNGNGNGASVLPAGPAQFPSSINTSGQPEGEASEIVDAEFQVKPDAAVTPGPVAQSSTSSASPPAGKAVPESHFADVTKGEGYCTAEQSEAIRNLYVELVVPYEVQEGILKKRGVQSLRNLTTQQAAEIIAALEAKRPPKS